MRNACFLTLGLAVLALQGCASGRREDPYRGQRQEARDPLKAQALTQRAAEIMESNPARAEDLLKEALGADLYHGPAHNNLGVLYLQRGQLYEAASEFEWARKLMPGNPDPRINLGLTLESAGRVDEALRAYRAALESAPEHIGAMQGFTMLHIRTSRQHPLLRSYLSEIAMRGESEPWRQWARSQLIAPE